MERIVLDPELRRDTVIDLLRSASERLCLSLFRCSDVGVLEELGAALRRGVRVEVLLTKRAKGWKRRLQELWTSLEQMGARVHRYADPVVKYHAKYIVADDARALVGSLNFTRKCFERTSDFLHVTTDPEVVGGLVRLFDVDCGRGQPEASFGSRLVLGPDGARQRLAEILQGARRSVRIIDTKVTDPSMVRLLDRLRVESGIAVDILSARKLGALRSHGKLMLVDGSRAVIGSMSLSALSLEFRRELALVIDDPECVAELDRWYDRLALAPVAGVPERP
jgi:phosphatidylserine/phosphatidylglycerophosphate/cardiolipin synthase-like enzyme